jgi:hypothetical protein
MTFFPCPSGLGGVGWPGGVVEAGVLSAGRLGALASPWPGAAAVAGITAFAGLTGLGWLTGLTGLGVETDCPIGSLAGDPTLAKNGLNQAKMLIMIPATVPHTPTTAI